MNSKYIRFFLNISVVLLYAGSCTSQSALDAAGGDDNSFAGSLSFSVGQPFFQSFQDVGVISIEGVQQPHVLLVDDVPATDNESGLILAYPNPTREEVWVEIVGPMIGADYLVIYDVTGRKVHEFVLSDKLTKIDVARLATACYSFCFYADHQLIQQIRILKIN